ncbi:hypothetical protein [Streptomyces sp. NEAU-174]|uniref:hypothetical protein n=1 Tax=Streptomyces sp. NEAU-174 TaxID=3458254 RepID=UPI004044DDEB
MDEGWAAVAAGVAAFLGAVASGWYTGRAARQGAEKAADAVLRQVVDQGAIEHGHWLRNQRQETYVTYIGEWDRALAAVEEQWERARLRIGGPPQSDGIQAADIRDELDRATISVETCYERLMVLGPESVEERALELLGDLQDLRLRAWEMAGDVTGGRAGPIHDAWTQTRNSMHESRAEFLYAVRDVLGAAPKPRA